MIQRILYLFVMTMTGWMSLFCSALAREQGYLWFACAMGPFRIDGLGNPLKGGFRGKT